MFTRKKIIGLYSTVLFETFSVAALGVVYGIMLSHISQYAMSAVSMVETINVIVVNLFVSISTGVAVKVSQYIGANRPLDAKECIEQSIVLTLVISAGVMAAILIFGKQIISILYGEADFRIISDSNLFLITNAVSFPFQALFSVCNSIFRGMGEYKITLLAGIVINLMNTALAALFIFGLDMGVFGAGVSLIISRATCGVLLYIWLRRGVSYIKIGKLFNRLQRSTVMSVLKISIPAAIDSLISNSGRVIVQTLVVGLGTAAIASNAVANNILNLLLVPGNAMAVMAVTVIGQSFGEGDLVRTRSYMWRILWGSSGVLLVVSLASWAFMKPIIGLYNPAPEVFEITRGILNMVLISYPLFWSFSFVSPAVLRGTGDVKYATTVSIACMWCVRVILAYILDVTFGLGIYGIWLAMILDWVVRTAFFAPRIISKKWERLDRI